MKILVKALSVKQPHANLIAYGPKRIETRTWATRYRGPLLICSSKVPRVEPAGRAVAIAWLETCRPMTEADEEAACCGAYPQAVAWCLVEVESVAKPFRVRGQQGLFAVAIESDSQVGRYVERMMAARTEGGDP